MARRKKLDWKERFVAITRQRAREGAYDRNMALRDLCLSPDGADPHLVMGLLAVEMLNDNPQGAAWMLAELGRFWRPQPKPAEPAQREGKDKITVVIAKYGPTPPRLIEAQAPKQIETAAEAEDGELDDEDEKERW